MTRPSTIKDLPLLNYNVLDLRKNELQISGSDFANKLNEFIGKKKYSRSSVNNWEQGTGLKLDDLLAICGCFHVSADSMLFDKAPAYRSDEKRVVDAADYTGLSHKAITVLHDIKGYGFDLSALSKILEQIAFYRTVLVEANKVLNSKEHIDAQLTMDETILLDSLEKKGFHLENALEMAQHAGRRAGIDLNIILDNMLSRNEYLLEYEKSMNDRFIDSLKQDTVDPPLEEIVREYSSEEGQ